jgi:gifsy-2 prophage putative recA/radA recombinase
MASATYFQRGEALDYTNTGSDKITVGTVIKIGTRIGIAGDDILPKATGTIHVSGVFEFKKTGTNEVKMGTNVYFDGTGITETVGSNTPAGYAAEDAAASATYIKVKIG